MTYTPDTPLEALAGIGPKKAQAFQKLGVATLRDLAGLYPRRYEDRTQFRTIADAQPGEAVCIRAAVAAEPRAQYVRSGLTLVKVRIADDTGMTEEQIARVAYLVGHHHTLRNIHGPDYQILIEADYIANASENGYSKQSVMHFMDTVMKTASGKHLAASVLGISASSLGCAGR